MQIRDKARYAAFKAKDARFDGRFFVGVSSTGIYCRPVCRAKLPKPENCRFFETAAAAEQAGFRPCLLCRPELAPGAAPVDATASLARRAASLLEESCGGGHSVEQLAARLGCTGRHLRRAFAAEYGVSPVRYLQTCRLLLAKGLLTDTDLSVIDIAMAAGFGSLRRFNDLFKTQYRLAPTALRREAAGQTEKSGSGGATVLLGYRPPYLWEPMLNFLAQRAIPGVEVVQNGEYRRTVRCELGGRRLFGWIGVSHQPKRNALCVNVSAALLPALPQVLSRVRHLFDLNCDPAAIFETLESMNRLRPGLAVLGARLPGCFDPFEMAVRAVLGQQITVKAAQTLAARLAETYGAPIESGIAGLARCFPSAGDIAALQGPIADRLGPLGVAGARANTILALALALERGELELGHCARPESELKNLLALRGVGPWTAQYIAMRAMAWPDAFPDTDYGVKKALAPRSQKEMLALAESWRPWRSYATINLWNSL